MTLPVVRATTSALDDLTVPARSRVDPADVVVPDGYEVSRTALGI
jgi:hypothetical protein